MAEELGDRLDGDLCVEEVAAEGPPEGVVGEVESQALAKRLDDHLVKGAGVFPVRPRLGLVLLVAPDDQGARVLPMWVVLPHSGHDEAALFHPLVEDFLGHVVGA